MEVFSLEMPSLLYVDWPGGTRNLVFGHCMLKKRLRGTLTQADCFIEG